MLRLKTFGGLVIRRDGTPAEGAGAQRRRLALLALLAATGERGMSRERLLGLLWPESDLERARKNLAQAVYALRRDLGADELIIGTADLRLNCDHITSDVAEFRAAISAGRLEEAVALYDGPFLDGIYIDEAPEFERWAEAERGNLAHEYVAALEQLARKATDTGDHRTAIGYWRRLANADPLNGGVAAGLMRALAAQGDRGAALQHFRVYEMLLKQELELEPDGKLKALAEELRSDSVVEPRRPALNTPTSSPAARPAPSAEPPVPSFEPPARRPDLPEPPTDTLRSTPAVARPIPPTGSRAPDGERRASSAESALSGHTDEYARPRPLGARATIPPALERRPAEPVRKPFLKRTSTRLGIALGFGLGLLVTVALLLMQRGRAPDTDAVVAVGMIQDYTRSDEGLTRPLADMLATDLARAPGMNVISTARMYELMAQGEAGGDTTARIMKAARASGATELIDGALYAMRDGRLRLDLKRTNLATGNVVASHSSEADDLFELVSDARQQLAGAVDSASGSLADVTTRSVMAYRLYEEGLRAVMSNDHASARRLFSNALAEDSTFAMAAYWLAKLGGGYNDVPLIQGLERAMRLAERASDRERLTIRAAWANAVDDPSRVAIAETLTVRYPNEPEGYLWLARSRAWGGDFLGAIGPLRRVIVMDSLSLKVDPQRPGSATRCYACDAYHELNGTYHLLDSLPAAERVSKEWLSRQPRSSAAAFHVAFSYLFRDRFTETVAALQALTAIDPNAHQEGFRAQLNLRTGNLQAFEEYFSQLVTGTLEGEGNKWMTILRRNQGRPQDGLEYARRLRQAEPVRRRDAAPYNALFEAQIWFDAGDYRRSAALFDSITRAPRDKTPSQLARHRAWTQTLRATALAAAGDTARLSALADSVERWGAGSAYGRDQRLHHHIRGLLAAARGKDEEAVVEFERAIFSPTIGYTRTNLELAKALLRLNRPREAAAWVGAALRGPADGANTYATRAELVELAAMAWDAAGERDSALTRYRDLVRYWEHSDPAYSARLERARLRLAALAKR